MRERYNPASFDDRQERLPNLPRKPFVIDPVPESTPTYTLDRQIARARKRIGEKRWAELQAEWGK